MNIMAGNAGPAFSSRDMEIVEIQIPIAEISQGGRFFEKCLGLFMALEAKAIKFRVIGVVEFIRKEACPVFCQIRSMKRVTGGAHPLVDHPMPRGCTFYLFGDLFMTTVTKLNLLGPLAHEMFITGCMGVVTGQTIF